MVLLVDGNLLAVLLGGLVAAGTHTAACERRPGVGTCKQDVVVDPAHRRQLRDIEGLEAYDTADLEAFRAFLLEGFQGGAGIRGNPQGPPWPSSPVAGYCETVVAGAES